VNLNGVGCQGHRLRRLQGREGQTRRRLHLSGLHRLGQVDGGHDGLRRLYGWRKAHGGYQGSGGLSRSHRDRRHDGRPRHGGHQLRYWKRHGYRRWGYRHCHGQSLINWPRRQVHADDRSLIRGLLRSLAWLPGLAARIASGSLEAQSQLGILFQQEVVGGAKFRNLEREAGTLVFVAGYLCTYCGAPWYFLPCSPDVGGCCSLTLVLGIIGRLL